MTCSITIDTFKDISQRGRMAYGIMSAEEYILAHCPNEDWSPVFSILWRFTKEPMWEEWRALVIDILPECFLEFPDYASSDFSLLSEDQYNHISELYKNQPEQWNEIIESLFEMENHYAYGAFDDEGIECTESLMNIINILRQENLDLPDIELIKFSSFSEASGRGNPFDGVRFSKILG